MRVALVPSPPFEEIGGVSTHAYMLKKGLEELGHHVQVVSAYPPRLYRAPIVSLPSMLIGHYSGYAAHCWRHATNGFYYLAQSLMSEGMGLDVVNIQNVQHVKIAQVLKSITGCRIVLTVHGFLTYEAEQAGWCSPHDRLWNWLWSMETSGYAAVDNVVAVSSNTCRYVERFSHARIEVIHNGIDTGLFCPGAGTKQKRSTFRLLFAGVLEAHKGLLDAIRALSIVRRHGVNAELCIAGRGSEEGRGRQLAADLCVADYVQWRGSVSKPEMPVFYRSGDVLLVPSKPRGLGAGEEPFGYTALEGMACGLPVVVYRTGGLPELVADGSNGYIVPEGDVDAMAAAAITLTDTDLRERMKRNARHNVEEQFSELGMARKFLAVYGNEPLT